MDQRKAFGDAGEDLAASFLEGKGMRVIARNARTAFGEIDLVCELRDALVFAEVKTRQTDDFGNPEEAITAAKFRHMRASAEAWTEEHGCVSRAWRLDVVAILLLPGREPDIVHFEAVDSPYGG